MSLKALLLFTVALISLHYSSAADKIICYDSSWAIYRPGDGSFKPGYIDPDLCTHVLYAFLGVNSDGTLKMLDPWNEVDLGSLASMQALKYANPDLKVLISIGGYNAGNALLNGIISSSKLRKNLIDSCLSFFAEWDYDGIDIAWEYPNPSEKHSFVILLQEMRAAFEERGYILSVTVAASPISSYDVPEISDVADVINVLSFDLHTYFSGVTGFNSPLYGSQSVNSSVTSWLHAGADKSKLTVGVPFYGHTYSLINENNHGVGAPASMGIAGPYTQNPGSLGYNEICEFYDDWVRVWDEKAQVPYRYNGANWLSYDDAESIGLKAKYAKENGLGGIMIWSVDTDDFHGVCGTQFILLNSIRENMF